MLNMEESIDQTEETVAVARHRRKAPVVFGIIAGVLLLGGVATAVGTKLRDGGVENGEAKVVAPITTGSLNGSEWSAEVQGTTRPGQYCLTVVVAEGKAGRCELDWASVKNPIAILVPATSSWVKGGAPDGERATSWVVVAAGPPDREIVVGSDMNRTDDDVSLTQARGASTKIIEVDGKQYTATAVVVTVDKAGQSPEVKFRD